MSTTIYGDIEDGLDFDDVLLMPRGVSNVVSRELVTLTTQYRDKMGGLRELVPIFTAPMKNISEPCVFKIFTDNGTTRWSGRAGESPARGQACARKYSDLDV